MYRIDIKGMRKARKMTQEQVGILAGMSKSQVSRIENGTLGGPRTYARIMDALGYDLQIQVRDLRQGNPLDRENVLSLLRVYYLRNKESMGIESIGLFGSVARNEARPDSDIDILVSLKSPDLFQYATIAYQLETVFGRHVDLVSEKSHLKKSFRQQIQKEVIYVDSPSSVPAE